MTAEELRIVRSDLHTKRRYNLTDEEFEEYVERLGICLWQGHLSLRQAHITALKQLGKYKIKTI